VNQKQKELADRRDDELPLWTIDTSEYLVDDKYMRLRLDSCTTPAGGKVEKYFVLEYNDWVNCLAIDGDDNVVMLNHYRHGVRKYLPEFVAGGIDTEDASPEVAARRELEEEAGYTGGTLYYVGAGYTNPASHTNKIHTFLAVGGRIDREQSLEVGESIVVEKVPFKQVIEQMSSPGTVYPVLYIAALFYIMNFIQASSDPALQHLKKYIS
jgi:ADP-ribose pyrophosphatase